MKKTPLKRSSWIRSGKKPAREKGEAPMFPKPSQIKKEPPAVRVFKDGREVCNQLTKSGRDEYARRKDDMHARQNGICCLFGIAPNCPGKLKRSEAMFEHQDGRGQGGGHHDDRIEKDGKPYNGVSHPYCNTWKASRRINYNEIDELIP